ncbi:hypothetical protein Q1W71_17880 [Flavobacterium pectinovorum]|uniref:hypothetical protein n=1 Tax=Flavobacterium pectinovorum TaxID=29533 RepID=UPI00265EEAFC|nr:hypothetical protein [Flavobacterium pectinovorum]WKL50576.1 hypothetical protein Q1W71_17880 [Flavobacterium pectinovorum]
MGILLRYYICCVLFCRLRATIYLFPILIMRKFTKRVIVFLAPIILLTIFMEILSRRIPNDYSYKNKYLEHNSDKIEILFLGSSHTYYGIDPLYFKKKSFNAAHVSQSLDYDLAILTKYKNWSNLKYIVVPVDYFSLYSTLDSGAERWRKKKYKIYYDIDLNTKMFYNFEIIDGKLKDHFSRIKRYYSEGIDDITCNKLGWGTRHKSTESNDLNETGMEAAKRHTLDIENNVCYKENIERLNKIIQFAELRNIKVIFITSPAYKTYVDNLAPKQIKNTIYTMTQLSNKNKNKNTSYYNLLNDKSFVYKDFYDGDHLNEIGAKKLSGIINNLINKEE